MFVRGIFEVRAGDTEPPAEKASNAKHERKMVQTDRFRLNTIMGPGSNSAMIRSCVLVLVFLAVASGNLVLRGQSADEKAEAEMRKAIKLMDRNLPESAIEAWDKALAFRPGYVPFLYEKSVCFVMAQRYLDALKIMNGIYEDVQLGDRGYQLLGNIHDFLQDTTSSRAVYRKGIEVYPNSGRLHFEMGQQYFVAYNKDEARKWWLRGTQAEPSYPKNYFWLAKAYADTKDKIWAIFYGEVFLNLERNTPRTKEMSELLFQLWNAALVSADTSDPINFCSDELLEVPSPWGPAKMSFPNAFEFTMGLARQAVVPNQGPVTKLSIQQLVEIRYRFTRAWAAAGHDTTYPNDVLSYNIWLQKEVRIREYLWWLYSYGDVKEMNKYFKTNENRYDTFLTWFSDNGMPITKPLCLGLGCP